MSAVGGGVGGKPQPFEIWGSHGRTRLRAAG